MNFNVKHKKSKTVQILCCYFLIVTEIKHRIIKSLLKQVFHVRITLRSNCHLFLKKKKGLTRIESFVKSTVNFLGHVIAIHIHHYLQCFFKKEVTSSSFKQHCLISTNLSVCFEEKLKVVSHICHHM